MHEPSLLEYIEIFLSLVSLLPAVISAVSKLELHVVARKMEHVLRVDELLEGERRSCDGLLKPLASVGVLLPYIGIFLGVEDAVSCGIELAQEVSLRLYVAIDRVFRHIRRCVFSDVGCPRSVLLVSLRRNLEERLLDKNLSYL